MMIMMIMIINYYDDDYDDDNYDDIKNSYLYNVASALPLPMLTLKMQLPIFIFSRLMMINNN